MGEAISRGLDMAGLLRPSGGSLEASAALSKALGPSARLELVARPWADFRAYVYGEASRNDYGAGVGVRWDW